MESGRTVQSAAFEDFFYSDDILHIPAESESARDLRHRSVGADDEICCYLMVIPSRLESETAFTVIKESPPGPPIHPMGDCFGKQSLVKHRHLSDPEFLMKTF